MGRKRLGPVVIALALLTVGAGYRLFVRAPRAAAALPAPPREIPVGGSLPALVLADDRGERVALASLRGAPTVLVFFRGASCPACRKQLAAFARAVAGFRAVGVEVVAASPDSPATLAKLRRDLDLPMRLLSDADEQAVNLLCGGLAHCELLTDARGVVRWGAFSETWSHPPAPEALLAAAGPPSGG